MADLKKEVRSLLKSLKSLTKQSEKLAKKVETVSKTKTKKTKAKKAKIKKAKAKKATPKKARRAAKKKAQPRRKTTVARTTRVPASDVVYKLIKRSKKGTDTAALIKKTGYKEKKVRDIIYRLKKQNKIKSAEKGLYIDIA
jgi:hypothetical protein